MVQRMNTHQQVKLRKPKRQFLAAHYLKQAIGETNFLLNHNILTVNYNLKKKKIICNQIRSTYPRLNYDKVEFMKLLHVAAVTISITKLPQNYDKEASL